MTMTATKLSLEKCVTALKRVKSYVTLKKYFKTFETSNYVSILLLTLS